MGRWAAWGWENAEAGCWGKAWSSLKLGARRRLEAGRQLGGISEAKGTRSGGWWEKTGRELGSGLKPANRQLGEAGGSQQAGVETRTQLRSDWEPTATGQARAGGWTPAGSWLGANWEAAWRQLGGGWEAAGRQLGVSLV